MVQCPVGVEGLTPCYYTSAAQTNYYRKGEINLPNSWVNWSVNGYRLPTEAEWEKAGRGGASGHRFPWSDADTINTSRANYYADPVTYAYDVSVMGGDDPTFNDGVEPYTSPVGYFAPNGYGLYDGTGNVANWCWDLYAAYSSAAQSDPRGPSSGVERVGRGGTWCCGPGRSSGQCRVAGPRPWSWDRLRLWPGIPLRSLGRSVGRLVKRGFRCFTPQSIRPTFLAKDLNRSSLRSQHKSNIKPSRQLCAWYAFSRYW